METTTVRVKIPTWRELNALRQTPSETPNDVIERLIQTCKNQNQDDAPASGHDGESRGEGEFLPLAMPGA